ncbi:MAG: branched-chain-amino-acid transaminase [Pseudonocardiaceae bacterium]
MADQLIYLDGTLVPPEQATVSVYDHGLLYGDGIYEGMRAYHGAVFQLRPHLQRLHRSARCLHLDLGLNTDELEQAVLATLRANDLSDAYIRLVVTRGSGKIGPNPASCPRSRLVIITEPTPPVHGAGAADTGLSARIVTIRRDPVDATTHQIKSLNYLNSVQATLEATHAGADEAIMLDTRGFVSESSVCNVFMLRDGELATPGESSAILRGITRDVVLDLAGADYTTAERDITPYELLTADEIFLTGTHAEIVPITSINAIPIGDGRPGDTYRTVVARFRDATLDPRYTTSILDPNRPIFPVRMRPA